MAIDWGFLQNPHLMVWRGMIDGFQVRMYLIDEILPVGEKIDFIFEDQTE